jgi:hypothetical protein
MQPFLLPKHLSSIYQDDRITIFRLDTLTPMDLHNDDRWVTRDLPSIQNNGMYYPILLYKITLEWWENRYKKLYSSLNRHATPIINNDGLIHAVKVGSNRYQCATHLGYETIDAIMLDNQEDCIKLGVWFRDCDPLNNKNAPAYTGAYEYKNVT